MSTIYAAHRWPTNAALVADVAELYLHPTMHAVDVTYGLGKWWDIWRPETLVRHGLASPAEPDHHDDGVDYRRLPEPAGTFDLAAFDPPYVTTGGRSTQGGAGAELAARYGMSSSAMSPADNQANTEAGLSELARVLRTSTRRSHPDTGIALVKVQDYITSGRLFDAVYRTTAAALNLGFIVLDRLELITSGGPQPTTNRDGTPRRQVHARRNHSTMLVLVKVDDRPVARMLYNPNRHNPRPEEVTP